MKLYTPSFIALFLANFCHVSSFAAFFLFPLIITDHGGNNRDIGIIMGTFAFASAFSRPWVATMIDRFGRKRCYAAGCLIMTLMPLMHLFLGEQLANNYPWLLIIRVIHGIGLAICFTSIMTFAVDIIPVSRLNEGVGIFGSSGLCGMAIGPLVGEFVLKSYGETAFFLCVSAFAFCAFLLQTPLQDQTQPVTSTSTCESTFLSLLLTRKQLTCAGIALTFGIGLAATGNFIAPFAEQRSLTLISAYYLAYSTAAVGIRFVAGKLADRVGEQQIIPWGIALAVIAMFLVPVVHGNGLLMLVGFLFGLGHGLLFPSLNAMAIRNEPYAVRGKVMGIFTGAIDCGSFTGALILGMIGQAVGFTALFLSAGFAMLSGLLIFRYRHK